MANQDIRILRVLYLLESVHLDGAVGVLGGQLLNGGCHRRLQLVARVVVIMDVGELAPVELLAE